MKTSVLFSLATSVAAEIISTGASVQLDDIHYFVSPYSQGSVKVNPDTLRTLPKALEFAPVTVVVEGVEIDSLQGLFGNWSAKDDVWQPSFLSAVFLSSLKGADTKSITLHEDTKSLVLPLETTTGVPSGPYFINIATGELHQAFRLYRDIVGAFSTGVLQTPDGRFQQLSAQVPASDTATVGVPSRLYFSPSAEKPLAGVRLGVKEIYDLAGLRKSNGNRAWWRLYPPAEATAPAIQNLIDAGAIVIGYQKTSQFANGEIPTADWVDYHSPFNPRGDGYNNPGSSTAGGAASIGAYEWLDIAIGTDTGGSIRGPAGDQGLFGNRPSKGLVTLEGVMPLSPTLDTPGFLVRDPRIWDAASNALYGENYTLYKSGEVKYPTKILTYEFEYYEGEVLELFEGFAKKLAAFVGANKTQALDLDAVWNRTAPESVRDVTIETLLNTTYTTLITKEQAKLVRDPFFKDYAAAYGGLKPFINPIPEFRWAWGDSVPDSWYDDAIRNKTIFKDWINSQVVTRSKNIKQCSDSILLYPATDGTASPRNEYISGPGIPFGFFGNRLSVFAEVPDSVFPIGEVTTKSPITGQDELLPVTISLIVAKGCDGILPRLAQDLIEREILKVPKPGRTLEGGEILLKRESGGQ